MLRLLRLWVGSFLAVSEDEVLWSGLFSAGLTLPSSNTDFLVNVVVAIAHCRKGSAALGARERFEVKMYAEVVLDVAELLDLLLAELTLEDVLESACLVVDAQSLDVMLGELLTGEVRGHLEFVDVFIIVVLFHDVT